MVNDLFDKLIDDLREKHLYVINTSEEIKGAESRCLGTIGKLEKTLNDEQKNLLLAIEEQYTDANLIETKYLYRAGIRDGMKLSRNIESCGYNRYQE